MTTSNDSIVRPAPKGFHRPVPAVDHLGYPLSYFDGPSRPTGNAELGEVMSAYSETDGFTVTIANVELSLPAAWRVLDALTNVLQAVEEARGRVRAGG